MSTEETPTQGDHPVEGTQPPICQHAYSASTQKTALRTVLSELRNGTNGKTYQREQLYTRLHALHLTGDASATIPDLTKIAPWPVKIHPRREHFRKEINDWISEISHNKKDLTRLLQSDVGGFAAAWAPEADENVAKWIGEYFTWLVLWDDKFDEAIAMNGTPTASERRESDGKANEWQRFALHCIPMTLLPEDYKNECIPASPDEEQNRLFWIFKAHIAAPLVEAYDHERRVLVTEEIKNYFKGVERECEIASWEDLPTIEQYWEYRMGAISFRFLLVANEFAANVRLPISLLKDPEMDNIWNAALEHTFLVNDLLSAYKEILNEEVGFLAILGANGACLQDAVNITVKAIAAAVKNFETSAETLMDKVKDDEKILEDLKKYLDNCRMSCQGNITWSMDTPRYKLDQFKSTQNDGSLTVRMPRAHSDDSSSPRTSTLKSRVKGFWSWTMGR